MSHARRCFVMVGVAGLTAMAACQDSATAPLMASAVMHSDALAPTRRVLRSQIGDGSELVFLAGETHVLLNGKAHLLAPSQQKAARAALALQDRLDANSVRFAARWKAAGLESEESAVRQRVAERKAQRNAAVAISGSMGGVRKAPATDAIGATASLDGPDDCTNREIEMLWLQIDYRSDIAEYKQWSQSALECGLNAFGTVQMTADEHGVTMSMSPCYAETFFAATYAASIQWDLLVLNDRAYWYDAYCR